MTRGWPLLLAVLALPAAPWARPIHYGGVSDPGLLACDQRQWQGQIAMASACYGQLLAAVKPVAVRAEAAWALGDLKAANLWFRDAVAAAPDNAELRTRWGWLFAQTHQASEAQVLFNEALEIAPAQPFAKVALASVLADSFSAEARQLAQAVADDLSAATGARIQAALLLARLALEEDQLDAASRWLEVADRSLATSVWPRLELLALRAAVAGVREQPVERWVNEALKINPTFGDIYAVPAYFMIVNRHYGKAIDWLQHAVRIQPELWPARVALAINLLRVNQIDPAREQLELAYQGDPFNPRTVNTLRLLDSFKDFEVSAWPNRDEPRLLLRLHQSEAAPLAPYVRSLAMQAVEEFAARYQFQLREPMVVELYPDHEDFAVRTVGLPGIGILGATFGYVLAMDSPSARPASEFHWATTLWHEVAHVYTLEASEHRVSRWFSEGLSVYEEWHSGPLPGRHIPLNVLAAMAEEKFLPLAQLDQGFVRPSYPDQVIVSYMQAGLVCEYLAATHGFNSLLKILEQYRLGADTPAALANGVGQPLAQIEDGFTQYIRNEFGSGLTVLSAWQIAHEKAAQAAAEGRWGSAEVNARLAVSLLPGQVGADSDYLVLARARALKDDTSGELVALETFWKGGGHAPAALQRLAQLLAAAERTEQAIAVLQSLHYVAPLTESTHGQLGEWLLGAGRPAEALLEFQVARALQPLDLAAAELNLALAYAALQQIAQARLHVLAALDIAPHFRPAQKLLLELTNNGS